jgi:polyribonucleotide nucleotidyltransferase
MESNGSTSMASVCGGTLALLDAGVPMIRPVAGISVGICTEYGGGQRSPATSSSPTSSAGKTRICDMDCKIAGTDKGITGFQLDLKLKGLPHCHHGRGRGKGPRRPPRRSSPKWPRRMPEPRTEISKYAPRIVTLKINPEKIGALIGPGGKNIKRLVEESGCEIDIEDDGTVNIFSVSPEGMKIAVDADRAASTAEAEIGKIYQWQRRDHQGIRRVRRSPPGQGRPRAHQRARQLPRRTSVEDIVKIGDEICRSSASAWTKRAACSCRARPRWKSAARSSPAPPTATRPAEGEAPRRRQRRRPS